MVEDPMPGYYIKNILKKFVSLTFGDNKKFSRVVYWEKRARQYGKKSVLDIRHSADEFDSVTKAQKDRMLPFLKKQLIGNEKAILDFGCGPGRFTVDLASLIKGKAIGVDPIKHLLDLAPRNQDVEYRLMSETAIPLEADSIDIVWICLVLGCIEKTALKMTIDEIRRVLKSDGLLFLIENTSEKKDAKHWRFRQFGEYKEMFPFISLVHLHDYFDFGERISIMAGRKV